MSAGTSEFFCLICLLLCSCTALTITAKRGQDVILPCKVPNNYNIKNITAVGWIRPDQDPEYVLLYRDGLFDPDSQNPSYEDRVDLQDKEMKDGDFSLILKNVTMEDTGIYMCRVFKKGKAELISIINLEVLPPAQKITAERGQDVILPCKVPNIKNINNITAVEWIRPGLDPEYVLVYRDGHINPENQHPSYQDRVDLQDKEMKDGDVSLILKNVLMDNTGTYECQVSQKGKKYLISIINLEVQDHSWKIKVGVGVGVGVPLGVVIILLILAVVLYFQIWKRKKKIQEDIERVTQENETLMNQLVELEGNHSETSSQLQQEKLINGILESHLKKKLERSYSDPSIELQLEKWRNEALMNHLMELELMGPNLQKMTLNKASLFDSRTFPLRR